MKDSLEEIKEMNLNCDLSIARNKLWNHFNEIYGFSFNWNVISVSGENLDIQLELAYPDVCFATIK
jgi:hypothetical protein